MTHGALEFNQPEEKRERGRDALSRLGGPRRGLWSRLLSAPLLVKLAGANTPLVAAATWVAFKAWSSTPVTLREIPLLMWVALVASVLLNLLLVHLALRPLGQVERTARRIWEGDFAARVPESPLADPDVRRLGRTLNLLIEALTGDRRRMRRLAADVIEETDRERSRIGDALHESTAQKLAAATMQLATIAREAEAGVPRERLASVRDAIDEVIEDVRGMARSIHARVLDDLGLPLALEQLVRIARDHCDARIQLEVRGDAARLSRPAAKTLYWVAREALSNAVRHARPRSIVMRLTVEPPHAQLTVDDDGDGFNEAALPAGHVGTGLFTMRQRVSLAEGQLELASTPGRGTTLRARIPLAERDAA